MVPGDDEVVVAVAVDGLRNTTSERAWSTACAWVRSTKGGEISHRVTVAIGWHGTLIEFEHMPEARSLAGIADEAYVFDQDRRIALREGELVAVVAVTRQVDDSATPLSAATSIAQLVADHIRGRG